MIKLPKKSTTLSKNSDAIWNHYTWTNDQNGWHKATHLILVINLSVETGLFHNYYVHGSAHYLSDAQKVPNFGYEQYLLPVVWPPVALIVPQKNTVPLQIAFHTKNLYLCHAKHVFVYLPFLTPWLASTIPNKQIGCHYSRFLL